MCAAEIHRVHNLLLDAQGKLVKFGELQGNLSFKSFQILSIFNFSPSLVLSPTAPMIAIQADKIPDIYHDLAEIQKRGSSQDE